MRGTLRHIFRRDPAVKVAQWAVPIVLLLCTLAAAVLWGVVGLRSPAVWLSKAGSDSTVWTIDSDGITRETTSYPIHTNEVMFVYSGGVSRIQWVPHKSDWFFFHTHEHVERLFYPPVASTLTDTELEHTSGKDTRTRQVQIYPGRITVGLTILLIVWTFVALYRYFPRQRRVKVRSVVRASRCPRCGYDLRATPSLCPECGWEPPAITARRFAAQMADIEVD